MDREELKLKLINELIDKGLSDDQILEIVEKHFPADVVAAPAPSTSVTPQQALNRTVAAIKKVKELSISKAEMPNIIDLTGKTQAEAYTALYGTGDNNIVMFYTNPGNGYGFLGWVVSKHTDSVVGSGIWTGRGIGQVGIRAFGIHKDSTSPLNNGNDWLGDPHTNEDMDIATKKYVDAIKVYDITGVNVGANTMDGTNDNKLVPTKAYTDSKAAGSLSVIASSGNVDLSTMSGADADKKLTTQAWVNSSISHKISRPKYHSVFWPRGIVNQARGGWVDILTTDKPIENFEIDWFTGYNNDNNPFTQNTGAWSDAKGYSLKIDELGTAVTFLFGNADDWDCGGQFNIRVSGGKLQGYISRPANSMNNGDLAVAFVIKEYVY